MRRTSAFTLIELLVVIAIIAILAAILFPCLCSGKGSRQKDSLSFEPEADGNWPLALHCGLRRHLPHHLLHGMERPMPCIQSSFQSSRPYQKSSLLVIDPADSQPLDYAAGSALLGFPTPCPAQPDVNKMSYQPNFKLIDVGEPNFLVNPYTGQTGRPVKNGSDVEFPSDTSAYADATIALQGGTANYITYQMPVQPRHGNVLNVVWADSHAKGMKAKEDRNSAGVQLGGLAWDQKTIKSWLITDSGPYQGLREIEGIPFKNSDGSWGLR